MDLKTRSTLLVRHSDQNRLRRNGVSKEIYAEIYHGVAPWEIGQPQPEIAQLASQGRIKGAVLDVGCGTGEIALFLASKGFDVLGIDFVETVVAQARSKATQRCLTVQFEVLDALELLSIGRCFDTVIDSATFHTFSDEQRVRYSSVLHAAMRPNSILHLLCISDKEDYVSGPRHVTKEEIYGTFADGWDVAAIREAQYLVTIVQGGARAWLAEIVRR